jgi:SAM-dependent methyltransferase
MDVSTAELKERIRQQFDFGPYMPHPLEQTAKDELNLLYAHSMVTPYYLRDHRVFDTKNAVILDAGCGTGYKALTLSLANPGAKVIGIDLSARSIEMAQQRFQYHRLENAEFHAIGIEEIEHLGLQFDYINCDEVLYLFPEPEVGLNALRQVLKPHGIIRGNLHSLLQRGGYFRAQETFRMLGLMDGNPEDFEIQMVMDILGSLHDDTNLKRYMPKTDSPKMNEEVRESVLMNLLFQGDRGFTIPDLFHALRSSDMELVEMVNWRQWEVLDLFQDPENLPGLIAMSLPEASAEECLRLYELLHPQHRLLDFWCAHPGVEKISLPLADEESAHLTNALVHIHPVLQHDKIRALLSTSAQSDQPCRINDQFDYTFKKGEEWVFESTIAGTLLPLLDGPQTILALADRYLKVRPVDPATLEPFDRQTALERVTITLKQLEVSAFVLIEGQV